ncbi:MAG: hypothetical protein V4649_02940 [Bacteroidota bacterium]
MTVQITLKQLNPDFDNEYARQHHHGEESDGNWNTNWSITFGSDENFVAYKKNKDANYTFGDAVISDVTIFEFSTEEGRSDEFVISNKLIDKIHIAESENHKTAHVYVYFKHTNNYYHIAKKIYIASEDCPEDLTQFILSLNNKS